MLLVWDKRVFEKVDCAVGLFSVGLFSVNVLLKEVVDDFVWDCSGECMGLMMIVSGLLYGRSLQGCTTGGIQHGLCLGISIPFDIRARDLVVRLLVWLCLLSQTSSRLITLWTYLLKGLRLLGLEIRG